MNFMKALVSFWCVLSILLVSPFALAAESDMLSLSQIRQNIVTGIAQMKSNIAQMDVNLQKIAPLLQETRLSPNDRATLLHQQQKLLDMRSNQAKELKKAQYYLRDFDANRPAIEKTRKESDDLDRRRAGLEKRYQIGNFRIFYSVRGADALPRERLADIDHNGVPDYIQNIALQLVHAEQFYMHVMGLEHPFKQPRFAEKDLRMIDINVVRSPLDAKQVRVKGKAWDHARELVRTYFRTQTAKTLMIDLSSDYDLTYGVPAHELFHLFQYGYTQFASAWFSEGTAVWAQNHFGGVTPTQWKVPKSKQQLFTQKYDSALFWDEMCKRVDHDGVIVPANLTKHRYIGRNYYIIPNHVAHCMHFMRNFLTQLSVVEARVTKERDLLPHNWPRTVRDSPNNESYIWEALRSVVE